MRRLDIATTKDAEERHAKVMRLGVTVSEQPANDGREGTIKTFIAGGKPRLRVFIPARYVAVTPADRSDDVLGGPSTEAADTGRWKVGTDGCYFDANDDGPDQCQAAQNGGGDDGEGYTCYDEGGNPTECATQQQHDDFLVVIAENEAEYDQINADIDATTAAAGGVLQQQPLGLRGRISARVRTLHSICPLMLGGNGSGGRRGGDVRRQTRRQPGIGPRVKGGDHRAGDHR